jgi:hypothetical protein
VFLLGAMVMLGYSALAIGLGVVTAAVLAYKQPLHGFVEKLGWDDVYAGLRLLIATFIALPLLPNEPIDPWGALNPYKLWLLVILISSLSLVGYADAPAWAEPRRGADRIERRSRVVDGGHLVILTRRPRPPADGKCDRNSARLGRHVRARPYLGGGRQPRTAFAIAAPLRGHGSRGRCIRSTALLSRGLSRTRRVKRHLEVKNPFSLIAAVKFAALFAVVLLAVKIVQQHFPPDGLYAVAALAGLGEACVAVISIVIAALSNTLVKCGMAFAVAGLALGKPLLMAMVATLLAGLAAALPCEQGSDLGAQSQAPIAWRRSATAAGKQVTSAARREPPPPRCPAARRLRLELAKANKPARPAAPC